MSMESSAGRGVHNRSYPAVEHNGCIADVEAATTTGTNSTGRQPTTTANTPELRNLFMASA
jgi:hypothetical protein